MRIFIILFIVVFVFQSCASKQPHPLVVYIDNAKNSSDEQLETILGLKDATNFQVCTNVLKSVDIDLKTSAYVNGSYYYFKKDLSRIQTHGKLNREYFSTNWDYYSRATSGEYIARKNINCNFEVLQKDISDLSNLEICESNLDIQTQKNTFLIFNRFYLKSDFHNYKEIQESIYSHYNAEQFSELEEYPWLAQEEYSFSEIKSIIQDDLITERNLNCSKILSDNSAKIKAAEIQKIKKANLEQEKIKSENVLRLKKDCEDLGFKKDTEAMGNCVLKLMEIGNTNVPVEAQSEEILSVELAKLKIEIERLKLEKARFENEKNQTKVAAYNAQIMAAMQRMQSTQNALKNFQNAQKSFESVGY